MDQRKLGNLALVAVACAWGTMIPVITHLSHGWDPFFLGAVRYVGGVPLLYGALWLREGFARPAVASVPSPKISHNPLKEWCRLRDLNSRPTAYKAVALPLS